MIVTVKKVSKQTIELAAKVAVEFYLQKKWLAQYGATPEGDLVRLSNGKRWSQRVLINGARAYIVATTVYNHKARPKPFTFSHRLEHTRPH